MKRSHIFANEEIYDVISPPPLLTDRSETDHGQDM